MLPFRKKKEDEEVADSKEEVKKPRKKRKKVEPPKPWGKIERIIVFAIFLLVPILSLIFLAHSKNSKNAKPIEVPIAPQIVSNIIPNPTPDTDELKQNLISETKDLTGTYGIWVQSLDGSYQVGVNENGKFDGASLFKLPLMINYYKSVDNGKIDPETNYTLKYSDAAAGAGTLATLPAGTNITYRDIVEAMGKNSDNTAFSIMINLLEPNAEINTINDLGMTDTDYKNSITNPYDIGLLFYKLQNNNLISNNSKNELLSFLEKTDFEDLIPKGIPENITIAHKYGSDDGELNDAGIVFANKPFIVVVLSKDIDPIEAEEEIPKLTKIVYDWSQK